jgi:2,4-diaminopentanoate dehydrogenase
MRSPSMEAILHAERGKPRIVVYGVGKYGQYIVRFAHQKGWPIVAAFNRAGDKIGQDIGRLADLDEDYGVAVQDCETADFDAVEADIAIVATTDRIAQNLPAYRRLLGAGINVICHGGEAYYPQGADPEIAAEIDALARAKGVSFTGTGIWDISRTWLAIVTVGNCTAIRSLFHRSVTNSEGFDLATVLGTGTGMTQDEFRQKITETAGLYANLYTLVPQHVLTALGYHVTSCTERREPVLSDRAVRSAMLGRTIEPGTCIGTRTVIEATTAEGITATAHMEVRPLFETGETEHMLWAVDGEPSSRVTIEREDSRHATASSMFNRIHDVIAALPGIQLVSALGPMRHSALD